MALLSNNTNQSVIGSGLTGFIDPNLLMLALGSGLLAASGPSPYKHGTLGLGLAQGLQNYFGLLPTLEKLRQMQLQREALQSVFGAITKPQNNIQNQPSPSPPPSSLPTETTLLESFGLPNKITLEPPKLPNLNERIKNWLSDKVDTNLSYGLPQYTPFSSNVTLGRIELDPFGILKKKDMVDSFDITRYPMFASAGATDASSPIVSTQKVTQQPSQTTIPLSTVRQVQTSQTATSKPATSPEEEAIKQMMDAYRKLYKLQQPQQMQKDQFPLTLEQMMILKAITGIDLFGAYEAWLKSRTPMVVGAGNYLVDPKTGQIVGHTPTKEGIHVVYPDGVPVALPIINYQELLAGLEGKTTEAKQRAESGYKLRTFYTADGTPILLTERDYLNLLNSLKNSGLTFGNIGLYPEPTSEAKEKSRSKEIKIQTNLQIAAKQFENILKLGDAAQKQYPIVELLENEIRKLAEAGVKTGPTTELQILFEKYLSNALGAHPPETLIGKILIEDIGQIIGLLIKGSGEDSLSPGNLNQAEQQFWLNMGPAITDPIQVMWAKLAMFKEVIDRQKTKAEMAQKWVSDFGSLFDKGRIYNPVTKRVEEMTWNEYWNKYIEYRGNRWLKKMKEFPWRLKQK